LYTRDPYEELEGPEEQYIEENCGSDNGRATEEARMAESAEVSELRRDFDAFKESMESKLKEANDRADAAEQKAEEAERKAERSEEKDMRVEAGRVASKVLESVENLPEKAKARIIGEAIRGDLPEREGSLDTAVVEERTRAALRSEVEYLGETSGIGKVKGAGDDGSLFKENANGGGSDDDTPDTALVEAFVRTGMSKEAAEVAARGR
jgi:hypothetical protein